MRPRVITRRHMSRPKIYGTSGQYIPSDLEAIRALKREGSSVVHGRHAQYIRGCRCDECVGWARTSRARSKRVAA